MFAMLVKLGSHHIGLDFIAHTDTLFEPNKHRDDMHMALFRVRGWVQVSEVFHEPLGE